MAEKKSETKKNKSTANKEKRNRKTKRGKQRKKKEWKEETFIETRGKFFNHCQNHERINLNENNICLTLLKL